MGVLMGSLGNYEEALKIFEKIIKYQTQIYGANHVDMALTRKNQAHILFTLDKMDESLGIYWEILKVIQRHYGEDHI